MKNIKLGTIKSLDPRQIWQDEARDFTPWLAKHIDQLAEAVGVPLEVESVEQSVGDFKLDIYATIEGSERKVVIENQLSPTNHKHLGQLMTYAAGLDASVVIWLSPHIRQEHKDAVDWLNDITQEAHSFFLVRPEVIQIGDSLPGLQFHVEAQPSDFLRGFQEVLQQEEAPRYQFRRQVWQYFLEYLSKKGHNWAQNRKVTKDHWLTTAGGSSGVVVNVVMAREQIRVEIYFMHKNASVNRERYEQIEAQAERVAQKMQPEKVVWEPLDKKKACRLSVYHPFDKERVLEEEAYRLELFEWLRINLEKMRNLSREIIK